MSQASLDQWVNRLSNVELPVLSGVMKEINAVTQASDSSAQQLSEIILKDAALTSKVLKIANSAYHNAAGSEITTISRAVVQLGFKGIKAICLSVMMIDSLMKKDAHARERMLRWLARGFHTAVQAENLIARKGNSEDKEEVFVTSLLLHMGDMAFWCSRGKDVEALDRALPEDAASDEDREREVLGVTMREITRELAHQWHVAPGILEVLEPGIHPSDNTRAVLLGEEISLAAEKGWESDEFNDVLVKASLFSGMGLEDLRTRIKQGADRAAAVAVNYGAAKICSYLPSSTEEQPRPVKPVLRADAQLQLDVLREMGTMVAQNVDINTLFQMVVEGIHRGVGLERVALCLADPKITRISAKYVLGDDTDSWREKLAYPVKSEQDNIFSLALHSRKILWLRKSTRAQHFHLLDKDIKALINTDNAMMAAVYAGKRSIGMIIADRGTEGAEISQEQHDSFSHFIQQTNMSLAMLAAQRANGNGNGGQSSGGRATKGGR